jgi:hypothetical protein
MAPANAVMTASTMSGAAHGARRLVRFRLGLAEEDSEVQPEHVERRQHRRREAADEHELAFDRMHRARTPERHEDRVLAEESGKRRQSGEGERPDKERPRGLGHLARQPAHLAHVLRAGAVDDRPCGEEQQALEEPVRDEVEYRRDQPAGAEGRHHVAELAHRRVREGAFDVGLGQREKCPERGREDAGRRDHRQCIVRRLEQRVRAGDEEHTGGDHRRRVQQAGDRRGASHGVREPEVQRELGGLADRADEQEQAREREEEAVRRFLGRAEEQRQIERPVPDEQQDDAGEEAHVADARRHERLDRRRARFGTLVPEADEQVAAQAHDLPEEHDLHEVAGRHDAEHRHREQ